MRILVVEDQEKIAGFIQSGLEEAGFFVAVCDDGEAGFERAISESFDAMVLDIMLPGRDGLSVLRGIRERHIALPVILLTARNELNERIEGLNLGADDYLTKPFFVEELVVRLNALIRRNTGRALTILQVGDLTMNLVNREVKRGERGIELTRREFAILEYLMSSPGRVFSRSQISEKVWNTHFDTGTNMVDVAMTRLRKKIEEEGEEKVIETVRGVGFRLKEAWKMPRYFRLRLALISAMISGIVLLVFGAMAWWSLNRSQIKSLDAELRHFGYRISLRTGRQVDTQKLEASLVDVFGVDRARNRFFALLTSDSRPIMKSVDWPEGMSPGIFRPGKIPLDPQPPDTYRRSPEKRPSPRTVFEPRFYTSEVEGANYRIGVFSNPDIILVLGANLQQHARDMHQLRRAFLVALPGALLFVALGAAYVSWRALRPVETLSEDMENVSARDLSNRLDVSGADREFERIIESYNAMLERLERSFLQATRFSADVSHELKW